MLHIILVPIKISSVHNVFIVVIHVMVMNIINVYHVILKVPVLLCKRTILVNVIQDISNKINLYVYVCIFNYYKIIYFQKNVLNNAKLVHWYITIVLVVVNNKIDI